MELNPWDDGGGAGGGGGGGGLQRWWESPVVVLLLPPSLSVRFSDLVWVPLFSFYFNFFFMLGEILDLSDDVANIVKIL